MKRCFVARTWLLAATACCAAGLSTVALAQPANDACSSASSFPIPAAGGTVTGTTVGATNDGAAPSCGGSGGLDVYHSFTPNAAGPWRLSLCTSSPAWDSVLSVHTNSCPTGGTTVACNDDFCGFLSNSQISSVTLVAGTTYIVRVSTYSDFEDPDAYTLVVSNTATPGACCAPAGTCTAVSGASACASPNTFISGGVCSPNPCPQPPANDECQPVFDATSGPFVFGGTGFSWTGSNAAATNSAGVSLATCTLTTGSSTNPPSGKDIYFKFTPSVDNAYNVTLCSSTPSWDSVLSLHTGCPASSVNQVFCNDDGTCSGGVGLSAILNQSLTAGTPYIIRVAGYGTAAASGNVNLQVSSDPLGTCCSPDGSSCTLVLGSNCASPNVFSAGNTCSANPCPIPAPANDDCNTAVVISSVPYTSPAPIQIGGAAGDLDISCNSTSASATNNGVWFTYTPSSNCSLSVTRTASGATTDTAAAIFTGDCSGLTEVSCSDPETVNFNLVGGTQYFILVGAWSGTPVTSSMTLSISANCVTPPPAPANDDCAGAIAVSSLPYTSGNIAVGGAANDLNLSCNSGGATQVNNGIWFTYTPSVSCSLRVTETGSLDTISGVFTGSCTGLSEVACSLPDTAPGFSAVAGTTYYILVGVQGLGVAGATSNIAVSIDCIAPPANDECAGALVVASTPYTSPTINMTPANPDLDVACNSTSATGTNNGVWFTYTATADGTLALNNTTGPDTVTTVFTGDCNALTEIACSDPSALTVTATSGTTYYILVGSWFSAPLTTNPTNLVFTLDLVVPPANDTCNTATLITSVPYNAALAPTPIGTATIDLGAFAADPSCNADEPDVENGIWFTYTPSADGTLSMREQSSFDSVQGIFSGTCGSLTQLGCSDGTPVTGDEFFFYPVTSGTQYYILVGGWGSGAAPIAQNAVFVLDLLPPAVPPTNDACNSATVISSLPFTSGNIANAGATADVNGTCNTGGATQVNNGVWFTYTPTSNCNFVMSETTAQDAIFVVFVGDCSLPLEAYCTVNETDNGVFSAAAGTQYFILVGRQGTAFAQPNENLNVSFNCLAAPTSAPGNDLCTGATVIGSLPFDSGDIFASLATNDADVTCNTTTATEAQQGVWFTYTATSDCIFALSETGPLDTATTVYTGSCGSLSPVACSDPESFSTPITAGTQYYILVSRWSTTPLATFDAYRLTANCLAIAANDQCANAINLNGNLPYSISVDNSTAQNDGTNPPQGSCDDFFVSADSGVDNSIYYTFTPATDGTFNLVNLVTNYDAIFLVYTGSCGGLTEVFCDSAASSASFAMTAGTTYTIVLGDEGTAEQGGSNTGQFTFVGTGPATSVCCRGTTSILTTSAACTAPAGVGVAFLSGSSTVNGTSNTSPCCYRDFNKDNAGNIDDIFIYLNAWFNPAANPFTKLNGDGVVNANIDDLFVFINVWFAGGCG